MFALGQPFVAAGNARSVCVGATLHLPARVQTPSAPAPIAVRMEQREYLRHKYQYRYLKTYI